jgi:hypothetical protein
MGRTNKKRPALCGRTLAVVGNLWLMFWYEAVIRGIITGLAGVLLF